MAGRYFDGTPTQDQVIVPVVVLNVGVTVMVTAAPVLVEVVVPVTTIVPPSLTCPDSILPTTAIVTPAPAQVVLLGSD